MSDRRQAQDKGHMERLAEDTIAVLAVFSLTLCVFALADLLLNVRCL